MYGFQYFPGLRHDVGWIGCGLSYKFIMRKAKEDRLDMISICEDDVVFGKQYQKQYGLVLIFFNGNKNKWDVFSGFLAETDGANVKAIEKFKGEELIFIDRMVSTVFNIYNNSIFDRFLQWDDKIRSTDNTIDRFLQRKELKIVTTLPFLVGHNEKLFSTLWGASNDIYIPLIEKSIKQLKCKISAYKKLIK